MLGNRRRDTKPELLIRRALHALGYRFRVDYRAVPPAGTHVDIAFTNRKVAIFIDGCFWHQCPVHGTSPKTHSDYWLPKLARNVERDRSDTAALEAAGWEVVRCWEHEDVVEVIERIAETVGPTRSP